MGNLGGEHYSPAEPLESAFSPHGPWGPWALGPTPKGVPQQRVWLPKYPRRACQLGGLVNWHGYEGFPRGPWHPIWGAGYGRRGFVLASVTGKFTDNLGSIACKLITPFLYSYMLLFKHACVFFPRFLLSRNYEIQIVARVGRKSAVVLSGRGHNLKKKQWSG